MCDSNLTIVPNIQEGEVTAINEAIEEVSKVEIRKLTADEWKDKAESLWILLDEIDTAGDMFKPEITPYFHYVNNKSQERFKHLTSDGYEVFPTLPEEKKPYTFGFSADNKGIVGLRKIEIYKSKDWKEIKFEDLHKGDIFRMFEPNGKPVMLNNNSKMKAISDVYSHPGYGVPAINIEMIPEVTTFSDGQCCFERNGDYLNLNDADTGDGLVIEIDSLLEGIAKLFPERGIRS